MIIYLYVKQHSVTGLKYFGKTINNPYSYTGSGKYWLQHLKTHGYEAVETIQTWAFTDIEECSNFALDFSNKNNIVESSEWANLIPEDAKTGGYNISSLLTEDAKAKAVSSRIKRYGVANGQTLTDDAKRKRKETKLSKYGHEMIQCHTEESKQKRHATQIGKYGSAWGAANTPEARLKAAAKHKLQLERKKNRPEVLELKRLSILYKQKLPRNYWQKSDEYVTDLLSTFRRVSSDILLHS